MNPDYKSADRAEYHIQYREDGKIPIGIWLVWMAFLVFAIIYISRNALPDFVKWAGEAKF